jgi:hypothetical protein
MKFGICKKCKCAVPSTLEEIANSLVVCDSCFDKYYKAKGTEQDVVSSPETTNVKHGQFPSEIPLAETLEKYTMILFGGVPDTTDVFVKLSDVAKILDDRISFYKNRVVIFKDDTALSLAIHFKLEELESIKKKLLGEKNV